MSWNELWINHFNVISINQLSIQWLKTKFYLLLLMKPYWFKRAYPYRYNCHCKQAGVCQRHPLRSCRNLLGCVCHRICYILFHSWVHHVSHPESWITLFADIRQQGALTRTVSGLVTRDGSCWAYHRTWLRIDFPINLNRKHPSQKA